MPTAGIGIRLSLVCGTSLGALVGAAHAAGEARLLQALGAQHRRGLPGVVFYHQRVGSARAPT
jgi:predicted acylesterase/phospholipase RssA